MPNPADNGQRNPKPDLRATKPGALVRPGRVVTFVGVTEDVPAKVVVRIESSTGMAIHVLDADHAEEYGQQLVDAARRARTGLQIPGRGFKVPPPPPSG